MNKQIKRLHSRLVRGITPKLELDREMRKINKMYCSEQDFETIAIEKGITVRELVTKWDFYVPELNNY